MLDYYLKDKTKRLQQCIICAKYMKKKFDLNIYSLLLELYQDGGIHEDIFKNLKEPN